MQRKAMSHRGMVRWPTEYTLRRGGPIFADETAQLDYSHIPGGEQTVL